MHDDEPHDLIGALIRYGTVDSVDLAARKCTVKIGDIVTQPVRWLHGAAGGTGGSSIWLPVTVGEQGILLAPEGDVSGAIFVPGVDSTANPAAGNSARALIRFADGAVIAYDPENHVLDVTLPAGGTANIVGDLHVTGTITADTDVIADGVSLNNHKHGGVQAGAAQTGVPA